MRARVNPRGRVTVSVVSCSEIVFLPMIEFSRPSKHMAWNEQVPGERFRRYQELNKQHE